MGSNSEEPGRMGKRGRRTKLAWTRTYSFAILRRMPETLAIFAIASRPTE